MLEVIIFMVCLSSGAVDVHLSDDTRYALETKKQVNKLNKILNKRDLNHLRWFLKKCKKED